MASPASTPTLIRYSRSIANHWPIHPRGSAADRGHGDRGVGEGKREAVVEPRLGGQGEPHLVLVPLLVGGLPHLHIRGQHRVGRGDRRCQQDRGRRRQPQRRPAEQGHRHDGQRHRDGQQPPGRRPPPPAHRAVQGQAGTHQRDDDAHLGQVHRDRPVRERVGVEELVEHGEDDDPRGQEDHRDRRGHPAQRSGQNGREERGHAAHGEEPGEDVHSRCLPHGCPGRTPVGRVAHHSRVRGNPASAQARTPPARSVARCSPSRWSDAAASELE